MAFDPALLNSRDRARLRLGDTADPPKIPEASYDAVLNSGIPYNEALAQLAEALALKFNAMASEATLGDQKVSFRDRAKNLLDFAKTLRLDTPAALPEGLGTADADGGRMEADCYYPF